MRIPEEIRKCVVFIGYVENDRFIPCGTGFFVYQTSGGRKFQHVVTARHVIVGIQGISPDIIIRVNTQQGGTELVLTHLGEWYFHPDEMGNVDVAVMPSHFPRQNLDILNIDIDSVIASPEVIAKEDIGPGDDVFITGLFTNHSGEDRNIPIVRIGNIAAMPEEPVWTNEGYMDLYLIEARSIGGLSGSPVFVHMAPLRVVNKEIVKSQYQYFFLGMVRGHFDVQQVEDVVVEDAFNKGSINTGIGVVIPADKIVETMNHPELIEKKVEILRNLKEKSGEVPDSIRTDSRRDEILKRMLDTPPGKSV